jgi:Leucine-rich repeat (LRR) protein
MKFIPKLLFIVLFQALANQYTVEGLYYNCSDPFLISQNCTCSISATRSGIISMTCNGGYLTNATQNTMPPISTTNVPLAISITNTYTMFPTIPVSYLSLPNFDLAHNKIQVIGDLTNLANTLSFFVENNLIKELPKTALCSLTKCQVIDLSYNLLEVIYFEDFVCDTTTSDLNTTSNYVFSSLLQLSLAGNFIKVGV